MCKFTFTLFFPSLITGSSQHLQIRLAQHGVHSVMLDIHIMSNYEWSIKRDMNISNSLVAEIEGTDIFWYLKHRYIYMQANSRFCWSIIGLPQSVSCYLVSRCFCGLQGRRYKNTSAQVGYSGLQPTLCPFQANIFGTEGIIVCVCLRAYMCVWTIMIYNEEISILYLIYKGCTLSLMIGTTKECSVNSVLSIADSKITWRLLLKHTWTE